MPGQPQKAEPASGTHVWLVLWKAYTAIREFAARNIASLGLSLTDFAILEALLHKGPLPVNDIGRKVALTSGSITTAVQRLEGRGFVERHNSDDDRRSRLVHLTAAGRKQIECAFDTHAKSIDELGEALTPDERDELVRLLKKLGHSVPPFPM